MKIGRLTIPERAIDHLFLPLLLSGLLSTCFYFILYNTDAADLLGRAGDPLFLRFGLLLPAAGTIALSFVVRSKETLGGAAAAVLLAAMYAGTYYNARYGGSELPDYYTYFQRAGTPFELVYLFYSLFFLIGGYAFGFLSRALEPPPVPDPVLGQASKTKRRKKKRKKALLKKKDELGKFVEDVAGPQGLLEDGDEFVDGDDETDEAEADADDEA